MLSLDAILRTLSAELVRRGKADSIDAALSMDRLKLAMLIMDTFIACVAHRSRVSERARHMRLCRAGLSELVSSLPAGDPHLIESPTFPRTRSYPLPASSDALIPWNWCALPKLMPNLAPLVNLLCY